MLQLIDLYVYLLIVICITKLIYYIYKKRTVNEQWEQSNMNN